MRARDVRAVIFCAVTIAGLFLILLATTQALVVPVAATAAYGAWLLTRPRMQRVFRRLRGEPDWSAYYDNEGSGRRFEAPRREPEPQPQPQPQWRGYYDYREAAARFDPGGPKARCDRAESPDR